VKVYRCPQAVEVIVGQTICTIRTAIEKAVPHGHTEVQMDTDVLIVGAGPVGLFLANECARRGLRYRLIETGSGQSEHSKALAIFPRTLEIFDMAAASLPFWKSRTGNLSCRAQQRALARLRFEPKGTPYSFVPMVPQDETEKILVDELRRKGGAVDYDTTFVSAIERDGHISATLDQEGKWFEVTSIFGSGL
jgi:2-polyprenyl-6-methoxyphenol hydroxylase-like FAD-dependent oxidoreductase